MKTNSKKFVALMLILVMLFSTVSNAFAVTTVGESLYTTLYTKVSSLFETNKSANAAKAILVASMLDDGAALQTKVGQKLDASTLSATLKTTYGFNSTNISNVITELRASIPSSLSDTSPEAQLFIDMYLDANLGTNYATYEADLEAMRDRIYAELPAAFTSELSAVQFQVVLNAVINDHVGSWNASYTGSNTRALGLSTTTKTKILTELTNLGVTDAAQMADATFELANIILKSIDEIVVTDAAVYTQMFELLKAASFINYTYTSAPVTPPVVTPDPEPEPEPEPEPVEDTVDVIENADEDTTEEELVEAVESAIEEAATVVVETTTVSSETVDTAITNALEALDTLTTALEDNDLGETATEVEVNVKIEVPADLEGELTIDTSAIDKLADNDMGLVVETEGVAFTLPADLMQTLTEPVTIETKPVTETLEKETESGSVDELSTIDATVATNGESIKGKVKLTFSLADLEGVDLDTLMVGVYEDGEWTKLPYEIIGNKVVFTAPHFSIYSLLKYTPSFEDIDTTWAKKYIVNTAARGIIAGKSAKAFDPKGVLTRAEFVTMLVNYLGLEGEVTSNFSDVDPEAWYYEFIGVAGMNSMTYGSTKGFFRPVDPITREEIFAMIARAYEIKTGKTLEGPALTFTDVEDVADSALAAAQGVVAKGIVSGYPDNTLQPKGFATRAEAATMLYLFIQNK